MKTFAKLFSLPRVGSQQSCPQGQEPFGGRMEFLLYFGDVFTPINFGLLLIGTIGGLILGATPGLSPTMAVALLIPFTFQLEAAQGLILLGAAYTSTVAGGAVSAILLKIPGAPANIATTLDGHTMAQKGEGAKALQVSFLSSAVGGVFGVLLLIFLTPTLAKWALAFGPSIPQVITMFAKGRVSADAEVMEVQEHPISGAFAALSKFKRALGIGTLTGSIIGLIPGVGGQIAGLVAYDQSKKFSPERDKFGTGHPEGVIAAESANNAMVGPSLVPLLTLSIPGSPTAAVLLGGLLIHGIFPGSDLFDNHPDVAWTFINSMLIGQVLMCIFGLYVAGMAARVAQVPQSGPIAESNFIQGSMIANATDGMTPYFFGGSLNIFLIAVVLASIAYSAYMELRTRRYTSKEEILG